MTDTPLFDSRVCSWISWCTAPGCPNCIRNEPHRELRMRCAVHAGFEEMVLLIGADIFQRSQRLAWLTTPRARRGFIEARA